MQLDFPECYDSLEDALKAAVMALGGFKKVAARMRPELDTSEDWLRHCLKGDRRERLSPQQVMWLLREARAIGFHGAMQFVAMTAGYDTPRAVDADKQKQALQEAIASGLERLNTQMAALQRMNAAGGAA
jgi:hypothetical protein